MENKLYELLNNIGIVPVVKIDRVDDAIPLAQALMDGNIPCAEITFRTESAAESIKLISQAFPEMLVGAGTVLTIEQVNSAVDSGAKFIVSPGLNPEIVKYCQSINVPILPGVANASDIEMALSLGLKVVKFFPAETNGGIKAIKALSGPFASLKFMPTGGVNTSNMMDYLQDESILACGGTWMVQEALINEKKFDEISRISKDAVNKILGFEISHIGLNPHNKIEENDVNGFEKIFNVSSVEGNTSIFVNNMVEFMKETGYGENGHIAIATNNIKRAQYFLENQGFSFNRDSSKYKKDKLNAIYLNEEIAGYAIHLLQK